MYICVNIKCILHYKHILYKYYCSVAEAGELIAGVLLNITPPIKSCLL